MENKNNSEMIVDKIFALPKSMEMEGLMPRGVFNKLYHENARDLSKINILRFRGICTVLRRVRELPQNDIGRRMDRIPAYQIIEIISWKIDRGHKRND